MIKRFMPALALGALCAVLAGCAFTADDLSTGVTESTDPVALRGEKVEAKDWDNALSETKNFSVKSTVSFPEGIEGSEAASMTVVYRFADDKAYLTMNSCMGEECEQGEAYAELGEKVKLWSRSKDADGWTKWYVDEYEPQDLAYLFGGVNGFDFAAGKYGNFEYDDAAKGYLATKEGLGAMETSLNSFAGNVLAMFTEEENFTTERFVLKFNGGKTSACLMDLSISGTPAPQSRDQEPENGGTSPEEPAPEDGTSGEKVTVAQLYFDYGKTEVELPEDLPALDGTEPQKPEIPEDPARRRLFR